MFLKHSQKANSCVKCPTFLRNHTGKHLATRTILVQPLTTPYSHCASISHLNTEVAAQLLLVQACSTHSLVMLHLYQLLVKHELVMRAPARRTPNRFSLDTGIIISWWLHLLTPLPANHQLVQVCDTVACAYESQNVGGR